MAFSEYDLTHNPTPLDIQNWEQTIAATIGPRLRGNVTTKDAVASALLRMQGGQNITVGVRFFVVGRRLEGAGSANDMAGYLVHSAWKSVNGTVTLLGATHTPRYAHEDVAGWQAEVVLVDGRPVLQVTGAASTTISWVGRLEALEVEH